MAGNVKCWYDTLSCPFCTAPSYAEENNVPESEIKAYGHLMTCSGPEHHQFHARDHVPSQQWEENGAAC